MAGRYQGTARHRPLISLKTLIDGVASFGKSTQDVPSALLWNLCGNLQLVIDHGFGYASAA
jgi:hypothetical protein